MGRAPRAAGGAPRRRARRSGQGRPLRLPAEDARRLQSPAALSQGQRERDGTRRNVLDRDGQGVRREERTGAADRRLLLGSAAAPALCLGRGSGNRRAGAWRGADRSHVRESGRRSAEEVVPRGPWPARAVSLRRVRAGPCWFCYHPVGDGEVTVRQRGASTMAIQHEVAERVFWPRGRRTVSARPIAARLPSLEGRTIGQLWDDLFRGDEIFPILEREIGRRWPGVKFVPYSVFGSTHGSDERRVLAELPARLRELKVDAVISGMAC